MQVPGRQNVHDLRASLPLQLTRADETEGNTMAKFAPVTYPYYEAHEHLIRRFDHQDDEGVIVAFCPNPDEAVKIMGALNLSIEHASLIALLNNTHGILREMQEKLDSPT
jgi:hypothetical protein